MPQDSLRSIVYRSLVHCDDPNGVVENETIRKSKTSSRTMARRKTRTYSNPSFVENETVRDKVVFKRTSEELQTSSPSFQLLKVSRGAQELNQMIDTWSREMNTHGQSKDIARDLLKGALDLQESLVMLCKLQDASKHMAKLKRKQKLKSEQEVNELGVERVDSNRFGEKTYELQNPQLSIGGSSRNCTEELRRVIRESLSRQNLLTVPSVEEDVYLNQMKLDKISDIPSTSSSQSSVVFSNEPVSLDHSVSSIAPQRKKAKAPSLIAKLMGLEEFPSKSIQIVADDSEKNVYQRKPIFDTERMPKPRKHCYCLDEDEDTGRKTLKEIIETMHFKGLLKGNNDVEGHDELGSSHLSETSWSSDEMPPIVIMKPLRLQHEETEVTTMLLEESIWDEGPSYCEEQEEKEEPLNQSFAQEDEEAMEPKEIVVKQEPAKKPLTREDNALNTKDMSRKLEVKAETPTKRSFQKDRASTSNYQIVKKQELRESKTMEKTAHNKMKASSVAQNHKQKPENTNKKVIKMEVLPNRRKPVEKAAAAAAATTVSRSQDQVRATITKSRKVETGLNITRNRMHLQDQDRTIQNPISKRTVKPVSQNAIDQTKKVRARKVKPVTESMPDRSKTNTDALQCKDRHKEIRPLVDKLTNVSSTTSTLLGEQFFPATEEQMKGPKIQIEDHKEDEQSVFHETRMQFDQHGSDIESSEEAKKLIDHKHTTFHLTKINLKELLLSSPSFHNCAEHLFDLNINQPMILQTTEMKEIDTVSRRLFLDCANELMEYKCLWTSRVVHPLLRTCVRNLRIDISLEELVEEICVGVENFKGYCKVVDDDNAQIQHVDSLFQVLESDLKSEGRMGNGRWDLGWMNGFSVNEADQVVGEMEKHVFSELLEEFIIDLLY